MFFLNKQPGFPKTNSLLGRENLLGRSCDAELRRHEVLHLLFLFLGGEEGVHDQRINLVMTHPNCFGCHDDMTASLVQCPVASYKHIML